MDAPPAGLRARPAGLADAAAIAELWSARSCTVIGVADTDLAEVEGMLTAPGRSLADETIVLLDDAGAVVGYGDAGYGGNTSAFRHVVHEIADAWVGGPAHAWLVEASCARAAALEAAAGRDRPCEVGTWADDPPTSRVLGELGFRLVRRYDLMHRTLDAGYAPPPAPAGVRFAPIASEAGLVAAHACFAEAFRDHDGGGFDELDRFLHGVQTAPAYAPDLSFLAWDGDTPLGAIICDPIFPEQDGWGYVRDLGVVRAGRGRGVGGGLLGQAFAAMAASGLVGVALHVDSDSLTGATRLYARAGMERAPRYGRWSRT